MLQIIRKSDKTTHGGSVMSASETMKFGGMGALTSVAIGGFLIQLIGVDFVFVLNAITFIASAALFFMLARRVQKSLAERQEVYSLCEQVFQ